MHIVVASHNEHKKEEFKRILQPLGVHVLTAKDMGISLGDVEEIGKTFAENACIKAFAALKATGMVSMADDSGLCVEYLDGAPGIFSARYVGKDATDKDRIEKLLSELKGVPDEKRNAKFVCSICCIFPDGKFIRVEEECHGKIAHEARGADGFGYDPVFEYKNGLTFAQMTDQKKDKVSHRGKALRSFCKIFEAERNKTLELDI